MGKNKLYFRSALSLSKGCIIALCVIVLGGCAKREIKNIDSKGENIICFGDSITVGTGASPQESYPSVLAEMVDIPVINAGLSGDTSGEALSRLKSDVLDKEPRLVIIEFGGNDFIRTIPLDETVRNIEEMVKQVHSAGAMAAIADVSTGIIMENYRKKYAQLSKKYNAIFIPSLLSGIFANPSLKSDTIHPNSQGYKVIAQKVSDAIKPYLK